MASEIVGAIPGVRQPLPEALMQVVCFGDQAVALQLLDEPETLAKLARGVLAASVAVSHAVAKEAANPDPDDTRLTDLIVGMQLLSGLALAMNDEVVHRGARS